MAFSLKILESRIVFHFNTASLFYFILLHQLTCRYDLNTACKLRFSSELQVWILKTSFSCHYSVIWNCALTFHAMCLSSCAKVRAQVLLLFSLSIPLWRELIVCTCTDTKFTMSSYSDFQYTYALVIIILIINFKVIIPLNFNNLHITVCCYSCSADSFEDTVALNLWDH